MIWWWNCVQKVFFSFYFSFFFASLLYLVSILKLFRFIYYINAIFQLYSWYSKSKLQFRDDFHMKTIKSKHLLIIFFTFSREILFLLYVLRRHITSYKTYYSLTMRQPSYFFISMCFIRFQFFLYASWKIVSVVTTNKTHRLALQTTFCSVLRII